MTGTYNGAALKPGDHVRVACSCYDDDCAWKEQVVRVSTVTPPDIILEGLPGSGLAGDWERFPIEQVTLVSRDDDADDQVPLC